MDDENDGELGGGGDSADISNTTLHDEEASFDFDSTKAYTSSLTNQGDDDKTPNKGKGWEIQEAKGKHVAVAAQNKAQDPKAPAKGAADTKADAKGDATGKAKLPQKPNFASTMKKAAAKKPPPWGPLAFGAICIAQFVSGNEKITLRGSIKEYKDAMPKPTPKVPTPVPAPGGDK